MLPLYQERLNVVRQNWVGVRERWEVQTCYQCFCHVSVVLGILFFLNILLVATLAPLSYQTWLLPICFAPLFVWVCLIFMMISYREGNQATCLVIHYFYPCVLSCAFACQCNRQMMKNTSCQDFYRLSIELDHDLDNIYFKHNQRLDQDQMVQMDTMFQFPQRLQRMENKLLLFANYNEKLRVKLPSLLTFHLIPSLHPLVLSFLL